MLILQLVHYKRLQPTRSVNALSKCPEVLPMSHQARSLRAAVAQNLPALTDDQTVLCKTMEFRSAALENTVGEEASCVRNLTKLSGVKGCVHQANLSSAGSLSVCGWKYQERPHLRVSLELALSLPAQPRCDHCWPPAGSASFAEEGSVSSDTGIQPLHHSEDSESGSPLHLEYDSRRS